MTIRGCSWERQACLHRTLASLHHFRGVSSIVVALASCSQQQRRVCDQSCIGRLIEDAFNAGGHESLRVHHHRKSWLLGKAPVSYEWGSRREVTSSRSGAHGPSCCLGGCDTSTWFPVETVVPDLQAGASSRFSSDLKLPPSLFRASLMAQTVKRLPATWETQVQSLGREDPLEKEVATRSSTLAWNIPWTEKPDRLQSTYQASQSMGLQRVTERLHFHFPSLFLLYMFPCIWDGMLVACCYLSRFLLHGTCMKQT